MGEGKRGVEVIDIMGDDDESEGVIDHRRRDDKVSKKGAPRHDQEAEKPDLQIEVPATETPTREDQAPPPAPKKEDMPWGRREKRYTN